MLRRFVTQGFSVCRSARLQKRAAWESQFAETASKFTQTIWTLTPRTLVRIQVQQPFVVNTKKANDFRG